MLSLDLHTHLVEKRTNPKKFWHYALQKNINSVAITEHIEYDARKAYCLLLQHKPKNMSLIPGLELNTEIGHIVCLKETPELYDIEELFQPNLPLSNLLKLKKKENLVLSIAHPYGFELDSAGYRTSEKTIYSLFRKGVGVEAFSGHLAIATQFFFTSKWFKKTKNFFTYLEQNKLMQKIKLSSAAHSFKEKLNSPSENLSDRINKTMLLSEKAPFLTAGSDAHSAERVGDVVLKINSKNNVSDILKNIQNKKKTIWFGPNIEEKNGKYKIEVKGPTKKEILQGSAYALKYYFLKKKREFSRRLRLNKG